MRQSIIRKMFVADLKAATITCVDIIEESSTEVLTSSYLCYEKKSKWKPVFDDIDSACKALADYASDLRQSCAEELKRKDEFCKQVSNKCADYKKKFSVQPMIRGKTDRETAELNGWVVGDLLLGTSHDGSMVIKLTAIGEQRVLAVWCWEEESVWRAEYAVEFMGREWTKIND